MKTFTTKSNLEVAECELAGEGLPITQDGAEQFDRLMWQRRNPRQKKQNQLRGLFGSTYRRNRTSQVC